MTLQSAMTADARLDRGQTGHSLVRGHKGPGNDACASRPPGTLSCYVTTVTAVAAAITFSASGAAPTPLYHGYQEHFGLTPFMITIIFAAYVLSLLLALLTVGSLSDYVGRRPTILAALTVNI